MEMADFFAMGGYGFYVWCSYGAAVLLIAAEIIIVLKRRREIFTRLRRWASLNRNTGDL